MAHNKQIEAAEAAQAATVKAIRDAGNYLTLDEQAEAERARMFAVHKAHDSLWMYYHLYPEHSPKVQDAQESQKSASRER